MNEKGVFTYIFVFLMISILFILIFVIITPALQTFITKSYSASEILLKDANTTAGGLTNTNIKNTIQNTLDSQISNTGSQVEILGFFYQNAWIILIFIIAIVLFLLARQSVEVQQQGVY
jgi:hypothetical protein